MICPKCLAVETEGHLRCQKCGAQLYTGLFQPPGGQQQRQRQEASSNRADSTRIQRITLLVLAVAVLVLLLVLSRLGTPVW